MGGGLYADLTHPITIDGKSINTTAVIAAICHEMHFNSPQAFPNGSDSETCANAYHIGPIWNVLSTSSQKLV